ncbi:hypothetical protein Ciccas_012524 [Cichlidogyrus casuarinus]|uniref:Uncharacterized protein n=1 Tax=Cichlidogyrus casuarinus TaxID=1844966 RepID=A0ABD2PQG4_9PLAT
MTQIFSFEQYLMILPGDHESELEIVLDMRGLPEDAPRLADICSWNINSTLMTTVNDYNHDEKGQVVKDLMAKAGFPAPSICETTGTSQGLLCFVIRGVIIKV